MPRYDYRCDKCGETVELTMLILETDIGIHNVSSSGPCGGYLRRIFSTFSIRIT